MSKKVIRNCDLNFHDITKIHFTESGPFKGSEVFKVHFQNSHGDEGQINFFFKSNIQLGSLTPLQKLKKICFDLGGFKFNINKEKA